MGIAVLKPKQTRDAHQTPRHSVGEIQYSDCWFRTFWSVSNPIVPQIVSIFSNHILKWCICNPSLTFIKDLLSFHQKPCQIDTMYKMSQMQRLLRHNHLFVYFIHLLHNADTHKTDKS